MKIVYLHGLDSNNKKPKNKWLHSVAETLDPFVNYRLPSIYSFIRTQIANFNPDIIVGSSMGGFFAYEIAKEFNIKMLLFNPALHSRSFQPDMSAHNQGKFKPMLHVVLGKNDDVIEPSQTINILKNDGYSDLDFVILEHSHQVPYDLFIEHITWFSRHLGLV